MSSIAEHARRFTEGQAAKIRLTEVEADRDAWRGHARADCAALRRVWRLAEDLDVVPAPEHWPVPVGTVGNVTAGQLIRNAITEEDPDE